MGRHTKGRRKRNDSGGPSIWFFVALAIGIALLAWAAITVIRTPVQTPQPAKTKTEIVVRVPRLA